VHEGSRDAATVHAVRGKLSDGLWCIRVTSDGGNEAELLFAHPKTAMLKLPATVFVIDEAGRAMSARVAADGPEAVTLMQ